MQEQTRKKSPRTPLFNAVSRIVEAVEDVVDDVVARGKDVERDSRHLVSNALRSRDDADEGEQVADDTAQ